MPSNDTVTRAFEGLAYVCGRRVGHYDTVPNVYPRKHIPHVGAWEIEANWRGQYRVLELASDDGPVTMPLWDGYVSGEEAYRLISVAHRAVNGAIVRVLAEVDSAKARA